MLYKLYTGKGTNKINDNCQNLIEIIDSKLNYCKNVAVICDHMLTVFQEELSCECHFARYICKYHYHYNYIFSYKSD